MNKGLEALKSFKSFTHEDDYIIENKTWKKVLIDNELKEKYELIEKELKDYKRLIEIISKYIEIDDNYDEMNSGSTKAFKVCIPNCISIEEDEDYTDDCYPNGDYDFINNLLKEGLEDD